MICTIPLLILVVLSLVFRKRPELKDKRKKIIDFLVLYLLITMLVFGCFLYLEYIPDYVDSVRGILIILALIGLSLFLSFSAYCFGSENEGRYWKRFGSLWLASVTDVKFKRRQKKETLPYGKRILFLIPSSFAITYMIHFFAITELYFGNINEWLFTYENIVTVALITSLIVFFALDIILPLFFRSKDSVGRIVLFETSLLTAMYLQNLLLNGNGFISGELPVHPWPDSILNILIWGILLVLPQVLYGQVKNKKTMISGAVFLSAALLLMQCVPLPMLLMTKREGGAYRSPTEERLLGDDQFVVSAERNIVVFIMDAYYNGFFENYLKEHGEAKEKLGDFTYYDNIVTDCYFTAFSLPYLLTSANVDFSISIADSNREAWQGENADEFYTVMHELGYRNFLYTDSAEYAGGYENMYGKIDNLGSIELQTGTDPWRTYSELLRLAYYRYLPFLVKEYFYVYDSSVVNGHTQLYYKGEQIVRRGTEEPQTITGESAFYGIDMYNFDYARSLQNGLTVQAGGNRLIFEHISGMHNPYYALDGETEVSEEEETEICMNILYSYMDDLKEKGLYDSTCIIVTADHGRRDIYQSDPLMLIKGFDEHGDELRIDRAPGMLQSDLLPTILDIAGADPSAISGGVSLLRLEENETRIRRIHAIKDRYDQPRRPKCNGAGFSTYNCYEEYCFEGRSEEIDEENDLVGIFPIYDYWW